MKNLLRILTVLFLVGATVYFSACDSGSDPQKSEKQTQIDLLVGTWNSSSVTHDLVNLNAEFNTFKVTITQAPGGAETMTFTTEGRPVGLPSPWPASGTISFGTPVTTAIVLDGSPANYAASGNSLTITFSGYSGTGSSGRIASAAGDWVFTFTK